MSDHATRNQKADTLSRRKAVGGVLAVTATTSGIVACTPERSPAPSRAPQVKTMDTKTRMPVVFLPHGGGPWPFVDLGGFVNAREVQSLGEYLSGLAARLPERPKAMVVVSAHWEAKVPTVMTSARPPMLYDYYGFPPESYRITWPAPGAPEVAARVRALLEASGVATASDSQRGFDHGTFVPLKLTFPNADVPALQLSLQEGLDPARHVAIGRALTALRDEGVLLVGSGMSFHNLREFRRPSTRAISDAFDAWLQRTAVKPADERNDELARWAMAPSARRAHPREEHLLPLMVIAGAAGEERGRVAYSDTFGDARISAVHFGA